jgi:uncharacterized membrane protein (UPF0127 family)
VVAAACSVIPAATTTTTAPALTIGTTPATAESASTTTAVATTSTLVTGEVVGFSTSLVVIDGVSFPVAVADTTELHLRGLMGVRDLGALSGMLFVWEQPVQLVFWMKNTLIPLDIAFISGGGEVVSFATMQPCKEDPCPSYGSDAPFAFALEVPAGSMPGLEVGGRIVLPGFP